MALAIDQSLIPPTSLRRLEDADGQKTVTTLPRSTERHIPRPLAVATDPINSSTTQQIITPAFITTLPSLGAAPTVDGNNSISTQTITPAFAHTPSSMRALPTIERLSIAGAAVRAIQTQGPSSLQATSLSAAPESVVEEATVIASIEVDDERPPRPYTRPFQPYNLAFRNRRRVKRFSTTPGSDGSRQSDTNLPVNALQASTRFAGPSDSPLTSIIAPSSSPPVGTKILIGHELAILGYQEDQITAALRATYYTGASVTVQACLDWIHNGSRRKAGVSDSPLTSIAEVSSSPPVRAKLVVVDELLALGYREDQVLAATHATHKSGNPVSVERCITWIRSHDSNEDTAFQRSRGSSQVGSTGPRRSRSSSGSDVVLRSTRSHRRDPSPEYMSIDSEDIDLEDIGSSEGSQDSDYEPIDALEVRDLYASLDRSSPSDRSDTEAGAEAVPTEEQDNEDEDGIYDDTSDRGFQLSVQASRLDAKRRVETLYSLQGCSCAREAVLKRQRGLRPRVQEPGRLSGPATIDDIYKYLRDLGIPNSCGNMDTYGRSSKNPRHEAPAPDWRLALAGDEEPAVLHMWASESRDASRLVQIERWFDIDAFIGEPTSLAVHRQGFWLSLYSRFSKQISQDQYLRFNGVKAYKCKHLRLGFGEASPDWNTYVLFPCMPLGPSKITHLTDEEQRVWVDEIMLRACGVTQSSRTQQRMPRNFEAARLKARAHQAETTSRQASNQMESFYLLPDDELHRLWEVVQTILSENRRGHDSYRGAFLLIAHWGCKDVFVAETMGQARSKFQAFFNRAFNERYMPRDCCWVDLAWEDVPDSGPAQRVGTTLLQKTHCLRNAFETAGFRKPRQYSWQMTQDAGSARCVAGWKHPNRAGGLVFMQGYNVEKEDFATPVKKHKLFSDNDLENLAVPESTLKRWAEANQMGHGAAVDRQLLLDAFVQSKKRAYTPLLGEEYGKDWGRRTEVRISTALLSMLDEPAPLPEGASLAFPGDGRHRAFWVLLDPKVSRFKVMNYNRYVAAIEVLIDRVSDNRDESESAQLEQQAHNSAMLKALIETLRYTANDGFPQEQSALWHRRYSPRHMQTFNINGRVRRARGAAGREKQGLGFRDSLANYNFAWLPADMFNWRTLTFKDNVLRQTTFLHRNFARFKHWKRQRLVDMEDRLLADITVKLRQAAGLDVNDRTQEGDLTIAHNLTLLRQLVSQSLAKYIIYNLMHPRRSRGIKPVPEMDPTRELLTRQERQGYAGLYPSLVRRALGNPNMCDRMAFPKGHHNPQPTGVRQNVTDYPNTWQWKLRLLLDDSLDFMPTWHNAPFRKLTSRCVAIIHETLGEHRAAQFRKYIGFNAARYIRMVPIFEKGRLRRNIKADPSTPGEAPNLTAWICAYRERTEKGHEYELCESAYVLENVNWTIPGPLMQQLADALPAMSDDESEGEHGDGNESEAESIWNSTDRLARHKTTDRN